MGIILCTHPVHGESHIQRNANRVILRQMNQKKWKSQPTISDFPQIS